MSDLEDDLPTNEVREEVSDQEAEEPRPEVSRHKKKKHRRREVEEDEEEEDEEEDEDDDEDEDDEDDEDAGESRGKKRRKKNRPAVNRFLDLVADVDEDEEEEEEEEEYTKDGFVDEAGGEVDDFDDLNQRAAHHARLDRREREFNDEDLERIAQDVTRRYRPAAQKYTGELNEIPQRLLMPSVQDANLWQVRVRPGKERDIVFSLMRKALDQEFSVRPLKILSAFQRDSLPGMIYVEARSSQQVDQAVQGLVGVFPSRGITLVPIEEMASLLQIKKKDTVVNPGSWVRIKRGKYGGDLAQVLDIAENGEEAGLKFVPRIDLNPKDEILTADGKKRKLKGPSSAQVARPPQNFFNYEEVVKVYGRRAVAKRNQVYVFNNDTFKDGYIEKDFKISGLILENVNPTLDEIMKFTRQEEGAEGEVGVDLSVIAETAKKEAIQVLQPGDHVEVFEGEQTGVHGVVESIANEIVTLRAIGVDIEGQKVDMPARSVRKRFKIGDHVKVMSGQNKDETGLVVSVVDNVVTFLSDMSMQEVSVFSRDLREAAEVGASTNVVGDYELHDLVQLDLQTVGVIFKTERDSFRVLDMNGEVRLVKPHQISMRKDSNRAIATDADGHELRVGDNVKEKEGEGRKGQVLHIHQSFFAFLHNRDIPENDGVFVTRARSLISLAPKGHLPKPGALDLTKMNPAMSGGASGGMVGSTGGRGPRDRLIGVSAVVIKGPNKGLRGIVKDTNGNQVRLELQVNNKVITIDKDKIKRKNVDGSLDALEGRSSNGFGSMGPPMPKDSWGGGKTPAWGGGRTPNPYADSSRTPAWGATGGRTPNPALDGGKTPAWNAGARTPAWNSSARTPNPYAADGGRTPAWAGGKTPAHPSSGGGGSGGGGGGWVSARSPAWAADGGTSPRWQPTSSNDSNWTDQAWAQSYSAPTPISAQTPAGNAQESWSESTPSSSWAGMIDQSPYARTPGASAPTPFGGAGDIAPTPFSAYPEPTSPAYSNGQDDAADWWKQGRDITENLIVDISGTNVPGKRWSNGEHEGKLAIVLSVLDLSNPELSCAIVKELPDRKTEHRVPIQYLKPHQPEKGDEVIVIAGEHKGLKGRLLEREGDNIFLEEEASGSLYGPVFHELVSARAK